MYIEIYVHPSLGDDCGNGTQASPYRSVQKAVTETVKISQNASENEEYTVNIMLGAGNNNIDHTLEITNLKSNFILNFKPYDGMYTTLSSAKRINSFDFEFSPEYNAYVYSFDQLPDTLYINGTPVPWVNAPAELGENSVCAGKLKNMLIYKPYKKENPAYTIAEISGSHSMFAINSCANISFEAIEFTGGGKDSAGVELRESQNISFRRCRFKSTDSKALRAAESSSCISVSDCEFIGINDVCLEFENSRDIKMHNNFFDSCSNSIIQADKCRNLYISSNTFAASQLPVLSAGEVSDCVFELNRADNCIGNLPLLNIMDKKSKISLNGNCMLTKNAVTEPYTAFISDVQQIGDSNNNVLCETSEWFTYNSIMQTNMNQMASVCNSYHVMDYPDGIYIVKVMNIPGNTDVSQMISAIIKNAGYRKVIRNYGDIM